MATRCKWYLSTIDSFFLPSNSSQAHTYTHTYIWNASFSTVTKIFKPTMHIASVIIEWYIHPVSPRSSSIATKIPYTRRPFCSAIHQKSKHSCPDSTSLLLPWNLPCRSRRGFLIAKCSNAVPFFPSLHFDQHSYCSIQSPESPLDIYYAVERYTPTLIDGNSCPSPFGV